MSYTHTGVGDRPPQACKFGGIQGPGRPGRTGRDRTVNERASHYGVHPTPIQGPSRIGAGHRNEPQNSAVPDPRNGHQGHSDVPSLGSHGVLSMSNDPHRVLRRNSPPSKRLDVKEWGSEEDDLPPKPVPSDTALPGMVFAVPDRLWGFEAVGREDHPGICTAARPGTGQATLVKGQDAATDRAPHRTRFVVEPSLMNGLRKTTSFELSPRIMSHPSRSHSFPRPPDGQT